MRYLNESKILLEEPEDENTLEPIDIENDIENEEDNVDSQEEESTSSNDVDAEEETPSQDEDIDSGLSSMINSSIVSTWNRIDEFTGMIATIKSYSNYESLESIFQSILDDEMIHIGQLQKALSLVSSSEDLISQGVEKAEEVIDSSKSTEIDDSDEVEDEDEEVIKDDEETQPEPNTDEIEDVEEDSEKEEEREVDESLVNESLVKRCKIRYSKNDDVKELQEMLKACNLKTSLSKNYILVEGKVKDIYNASGMIDIPVHEEDLF